MRDLIRKVLREAVGVPQGVLESAEVLYELVLKKLKTLPSEFEPQKNFIISTDLNIKDLNIKKIKLEFNFHKVPKVKEVEIYSMAVSQQSRFLNDILKIETVIKPGQIQMQINFAGPKKTKKSDIMNLMVKMKDKIVSSLAHELGHSYNDFKKQYKSSKEIVRYAGISRTQFPFAPINEFLHKLYYIHQIENLVRPIEVASMMKSGEIDREGFAKFLTDNSTYKKLKEIEEFSFDKMKDELKSDSDRIRQFLENIGLKGTKKLSDDKIVDELLRIVYVNLSNNTVSSLQHMMSTNPFEQILGFGGDKNKMFMDLAQFFSRFQDNYEAFYRYEEKNFKHTANKIKKKLLRLYDLAKVNPSSIENWDLHHKINTKNVQYETEIRFKRY